MSNAPRFAERLDRFAAAFADVANLTGGMPPTHTSEHPVVRRYWALRAAIIAERNAINQPTHDPQRYSIRFDGARLLVCRGDHHRSQDCEWEAWIPAPAQTGDAE